jgi:hypothetical protein
MAALDRAQTNLSTILKMRGHDMPRNWEHAGYTRKNQCRTCGQSFEVIGYQSAYGISATYSGNTNDACRAGVRA